MNDMPKISVIVPAYNVERWLSRCLESIINQTYQQLEVIVIDDGSKDGTGNILREYAKKEKRIVPIYQKNQGLVAVREVGIQRATGGYIGFVDGDDMIKLDFYERLLHNAVEYEADISHCGMELCYIDGRKEAHYGTGERFVQQGEESVIELLKGERVEPSLCNKLYKTELLLDSCLDASVVNNEDLLRNFIAFRRAKKTVFEDYCGYEYWMHEGSMSNHSNRLVIQEHVLHARKLILDHSETNTLKFYARRLWLSTIINGIHGCMNRKESDYNVQYKKYRMVLAKEKGHITCLIPRQQLAAWSILMMPALYKQVYKLYERKYR